MQSDPNILQVNNLSKFFGGLAAVSNCSLKIKKGSITGIIGPNGSGKTTLFNLIAGNLESSKGTVLFNDEDITKAETPFHILKSLDSVPEHRFFVVFEWQDRYEEATKQLGNWVKQGSLKYTESFGEGLSEAPSLFRGMLKGKNFGKQLVKIADV